MKRNFILLGLIAFLMQCSALQLMGQGQNSPVTWVASEQGYANQQLVTSFTIEANAIEGLLDKSNGSTAPAYYTSNLGVRMYANNTLSVSTLAGFSLNSIEYIFKKQGSKAYSSSALISDGGTYVAATSPVGGLYTDTWTYQGDYKGTVTIKLGSSGQRVLCQITVTYVGQANTLYQVHYHPNISGTTPYDDPSTYAYGATVTVLSPSHFGITNEGNVFTKWSTDINGQNGNDYLPGDQFTMGDGNVDLYAQWTSTTNTTVDELTPAVVNAGMGDQTGYCDWRTRVNRAYYLGKSFRADNFIQLTNSQSGNSAYSGIVTAISGGKARKVQVVWNSQTPEGRTLNVYAKNIAYSATSDLYGSTHGTLVGTLTKGSSSVSEVNISDDYAYIGLASASGAMYIERISVFWENGDVNAPTILMEPSPIALGNVVIGEPLQATFTVCQANLSADITLNTSSGLLDVSSIPQDNQPVSVTWSYTPNSTNVFPVTITATSGVEVVTTSTLEITATVLPANNFTSLHESKAAFLANSSATEVKINLANVEVVGQSGNYLYLQDAEAGVLVYGAGAPTFTKGYRFNQGYLLGTYASYNGVTEITDFNFVGYVGSENNALTETSATVDQILGNPVAYESRYVVINNTSISNWTLPGASVNLAFYDVFHTNYAFCTTPGTVEIFTVKGMVNRHWSNSAINVELAPTALSDISTTALAAAPTIMAGGTETTPVATTYVDITPGANATAVYSMWRQNGDVMELVVDNQRITSAIDISIIGKTEIKVHGERDFYVNTAEVDYWYDLPANTRSVQFSINGVIDPQNNVLVTSTLSPTQVPAVTVLGDFGLLGWSTVPSSTSVIDLGTYQFTQNTILYAVYYRGTSFQYVKVNNVADITEGEYVITVSSGSTPYTFKNVNASTPIAISIAEFGIELSGNQLVATQGQMADFEDISWTFTGTLSEMTIKSVAHSNSWLYTANENTGVRISSNVSGVVDWIISEDNLIPDLFNMKCNRNDRYLALYNNQDWRSYQTLTAPNSYPRIALYKKTAVVTNDVAKYTRVFWNENATADINITGPSIIPSGYYLKMGEHLLTNNVASNLVIEDDAILVLASGNGVKATVKKDIAGYVNDTVLTGWHLLSSPVGLISIDHQHAPGGLLVGDYDLYAFDQSKSLQWQNYEADATVVFGEQGGLLYANKDNTTIVFTGNLTASVQHEDLVYVANKPLSGWNLIGNPYMTNGYLNIEYTGQDEGTAITDYYYMKDVSENGKKFSKLIANSITNPVYPMEGVFVQAPSAGYKYWFVNSNRGQNVVQSEYVNIKLSGDDDEVVDVARVRFNEGSLMGKFDFGEGGSQLYIPQGGKKYAVVPTQRQGELPLSFKAAKNGTYTLTFDLDEAEMNYLHLIDNKTGADVDLLALRQAQGPATYTFNASVDDYTARFRLLFEANCALGNDHFAYYDGSAWVVTGHYDNATLQVVDMLGRVLSSQAINGSAELNINQAQGVYVLRLINGNEIKSQKIVVR